MTTAVNVSLIQGFLPALTVFASWIILREGTTPRAVAGMVISMMGVVVVISRGDLGLLFGLGPNLGDLLMLPAMASWALYTVFLRFKPPDLDPFAFILLTFIVGVVFVGAAYGVELAQGKTFTLNAATGSAIAYIALFPALIAYILWNRGVKAVGANVASQFQYLMPLWGSLLAVIFLGRGVSPVSPRRHRADLWRRLFGDGAPARAWPNVASSSRPPSLPGFRRSPCWSRCLPGPTPPP